MVLVPHTIPAMYRPKFKSCRVQKAGRDGKGIYLPKVFTDELNISSGDFLIAYLVDDVICIEKADRIGFQPKIISVRQE